MLPWELVELIMDNWDGRMLGLTCRRLSVRLQPDRYVVNFRVDLGHKNVRHGVKREITLSRLHNGIFHGKSIARMYSATRTCHDVVTYDRGRIVSSAYYEQDGERPVAFDIIVDGWGCAWHSSRLPHEPDQVSVSIDKDARPVNIGECDLDGFEAFARKEISAYGITGNRAELPVANRFACKHLPNTYH